MSESVVVELARWRATHVLEYLGRFFADVFAGASDEDLLNGRAGQGEPVANAFRRFLHSDLADLVEEVAEFPEFLRATWRRIGAKLKDRPPTDYQSLGELLDGLWALYEKTADFALGLVRRVEKLAGDTLPAASGVEAALAEIKRQRVNLLGHWPWAPSPARLNEAQAAMARGEGQDSEEAFADIAGIPVEELRRQIAERKNARQGA
jgi:hypothetical protein